MPPQASLQFTLPPWAADPCLARFHPVVQRWFTQTLGEPSRPQRDGWPAIGAGKDVLIAAPTGSGKTLSAFLAALDRLFRLALEHQLTDATQVLYVSPLKALGNDIQKNLILPLRQISELAKSLGLDPQPIHVQVRSGDTTPSERAGMVKRPPHILITTPESLYLYLTSRRARETLRSVHTVIVDEIHALARDKRGSHLALSLERLKSVTSVRPQLVGLSATQKPIELMAAFLVGSPEAACEVIQSGHVRPWDLRVETPDEELSAVATHEMWGQIYDRLVALSGEHKTILIFTNTRRMAERVAHDLGERLGLDKVAAHHGSMSRELRFAAEERLKAGELKVMCATASLELGIDIGHVDLVCQLGSPRAIAALLQRVGRANHHKDGISKGILFALTRDELVECAALLRAVREGILDAVWMPQKPLDILAQQIVAACAVESWDERELYLTFRRAYPYRNLTLEEFEQTLVMLSEGVALGRGRVRVHLHRDRVNRRIKGRKGVHITALTNGGAIPDTFSLPVIAEPEGKQIGTLDEDFAVDSSAGDVFLLGSSSWRIQSVRGGVVRVEDAHGQAPNVPFWRGEAPARTAELSFEVGRLRCDLLGMEAPELFLEQLGLSLAASEGMVRYLRAAQHVLGEIPTCQTIVAERFFDEAGGMQLLIHAPFGGRINRAWGLALRKRFCRSFDFELQAAATDDGLLLSLGEQHSFPLADIFEFLHPNTVEEVLLQAVLQAPLFETRFRWNATRALALQRFSNGQRVPPQLQRSRAEDLLAAVFPAQVGCQDNHGGAEVVPPDHPIVNETVSNCLREALDVDGLKEVLAAIRDGRISTLARDLPEPSPLAHALLNSQPYTFLDDAPAEERRARAVSVRRGLPAEDAAAMGALDVDAINQTVQDARPPLRSEDELHEALLQFILFPEAESCAGFMQSLITQGRAARALVAERVFFISVERVNAVRALFPDAVLTPPLLPLPGDGPVERELAMTAAVRGRMEVAGPLTAPGLALGLSLPEDEVTQALHRLESEGQVLRGKFRPQGAVGVLEWCDRRLLQRIHRLTVGRLRKEIEPLSGQDFMRFLFQWHHLEGREGLKGRQGLLAAVELLEGFEAPAAAWEHCLLPARVRDFSPDLLERVCWGGEVTWGRLTLRETRAAPGPRRGAAVETEDGPLRQKRARSSIPARNAALSFVKRTSLDWMLCAARREQLLETGETQLPGNLSAPAAAMAGALKRRGASFFQDLVVASGGDAEAAEEGLWELLARGFVTADGVDNLRVIQSSKKRKRQKVSRPGGNGRWSLLSPCALKSKEEVLDAQARLFLTRYGIVFRDLVLREPLAPSWRELLFVYRRLEARGEIRGGRFVAAFAGEQFAVPNAVDRARAVRRVPTRGSVVRITAVDPLNLTGLVTPGPRVPAVLGHWVTYLDGVPRLEQSPSEASASRAPVVKELQSVAPELQASLAPLDFTAGGLGHTA